MQQIYEREAPDLTRDYRPLPGPEDVEDQSDGLESTGLFGEVEVRRYSWDLEYDAASYIRVLNTYSGHRDLEGPKRDRLLRGIAELIDSKYGGHITKGYVTILYVARRK